MQSYGKRRLTVSEVRLRNVKNDAESTEKRGYCCRVVLVFNNLVSRLGLGSFGIN